MGKPLFSCVVAVKGARPHIREALESLRNQGLGDDLEVIVQDGDVERDAGLSDAFNKGFAKVQGEWLFWLNADDVLFPGALKKVALRIKRPMPDGDREISTAADNGKSLTWIAGNMATIDERGRVIRCLRDCGAKVAYEGHPVRVFGPSSFFRRELLDKVGGFDPSLKVAMDTDLWLKFRECGHWFEKIGDYLFGFRVHAGSATMNPDKPAWVQAEHDREVERVRAAHHVSVDAAYLRRRHLRRLLDGSYLKETFDTWRFHGKKWQEAFR